MNAQVLGISTDSRHSHKVYADSLGGVAYPLLSDFHPHGEMARSYGLWNDKTGTPIRGIVIVDKDGIIRYRKEYPFPPGGLPDAHDVLSEMDKLGLS
jgi:alkyl hydroperoxide reductase subunit AhpC